MPRVTLVGISERIADGPSTYGRVEETTADPEKYPRIHHETHTEAQGDVQKFRWISTQICWLRICGSSIDNVRASECKEKKRKSAREFSHHGDEMILDAEREEANQGDSPRNCRLPVRRKLLLATLPWQANGTCGSVDIHCCED